MSEPGSQSVEKAVAKHALIKRDAEVVELRFEAVLCRQAGGGQKPLLADRFDHRRIDERVANTPSSSGSLAYGLFLTSVLLSSMRLNPPDYLHVAVSRPFYAGAYSGFRAILNSPSLHSTFPMGCTSIFPMANLHTFWIASHRPLDDPILQSTGSTSTPFRARWNRLLLI